MILESISNGTAPAGIVVSEIDPIIGLGCILGEELLGKVVPVVLVSPEEWASILDESRVTIAPGGVLGIDEGSSVRDAGALSLYGVCGKR